MIFNMHTKLLLKTIIPYYITVTKDFFRLRKGQNRSADILQTAHRLEKGLTLSNQRPMWGWEKAKRLIELLNGQERSFSKETGLSVLSAYIEHKKLESEKDINELNLLLPRIKGLYLDKIGSYQSGGGKILKKEDVTVGDIRSFKDVINARHSIRDFDGTQVDKDKLIEAINMANKCPSACNRQSSKVYIIERETWKKYFKGKAVDGEDKHLLITAETTDFNIDEMNDWVVSASIFVGYLTLTLTAMGIGSCVIRKPLFGEKSVSDYHANLGIPKSEKIIIEIAIGNYKDEFKVAYSNRKTASDLIVWR